MKTFLLLQYSRLQRFIARFRAKPLLPESVDDVLSGFYKTVEDLGVVVDKQIENIAMHEVLIDTSTKARELAEREAQRAQDVKSKLVKLLGA